MNLAKDIIKGLKQLRDSLSDGKKPHPTDLRRIKNPKDGTVIYTRISQGKE